MPEEFVVGIDFRPWIGMNAIPLHIGLACKDGAMKRFDAPVVFHKLACEPFEEFGMGWFLARGTEIIWGRD